MSRFDREIVARALSWSLGNDPLADLAAFGKKERERMQRPPVVQALTDRQAEAIIRFAMKLGVEVDGKSPMLALQELERARTAHRAKLRPMNPDTKAIAFFENDEDARRAGHMIHLTKGEAERLMPVNRAERRRALREDRRSRRRALKG